MFFVWKKDKDWIPDMGFPQLRNDRYNNSDILMFLCNKAETSLQDKAQDDKININL